MNPNILMRPRASIGPRGCSSIRDKPPFLLRLLLVALFPTGVAVADALSDWRVLNRGGGPLNDVDYQNGVFVATGDTVLTSTNGTD
jgi:hypothetical protein